MGCTTSAEKKCSCGALKRKDTRRWRKMRRIATRMQQRESEGASNEAPVASDMQHDSEGSEEKTGSALSDNAPSEPVEVDTSEPVEVDTSEPSKRRSSTAGGLRPTPEDGASTPEDVTSQGLTASCTAEHDIVEPGVDGDACKGDVVKQARGGSQPRLRWKSQRKPQRHLTRCTINQLNIDMYFVSMDPENTPHRERHYSRLC